MSTTVWLARHGETSWAAEDRYNGRAESSLTEHGRQQAARLADRLAAQPLAAVYCSSLERTLETAQIVAQRHGLVPVPCDGLVEVDYGAWDGLLRSEIIDRYVELYGQWVHDPAAVVPPGGEAGYCALARAADALRGIVAGHRGQALLVVAHKAINRLLLCDVLGVPARYYRARIGQAPCALNCIEWRDAGPMVTLMNDISHYSQHLGGAG
jgi:broad specificity phosphatase PhoE